MKDTDIIDTAGKLNMALSAVDLSGQISTWNWRWDVALRSEGWIVRASFERPDRDTGVIGRGFGRWFYVEIGATARTVWGTAFTAIKLIVDHELLEAFTVDGRRVFDPHCPMVPEVLP